MARKVAVASVVDEPQQQEEDAPEEERVGRTELVGLNEVHLRGRVAALPEARVLPSGVEILTFRLTVPRQPTAMTRGSRATSDWLDCVAWEAPLRDQVRGWVGGEVVELTGSLRRRFFRAGGAAASRVELEVLGLSAVHPPVALVPPAEATAS